MIQIHNELQDFGSPSSCHPSFVLPELCSKYDPDPHDAMQEVRCAPYNRQDLPNYFTSPGRNGERDKEEASPITGTIGCTKNQESNKNQIIVVGV